MGYTTFEFYRDSYALEHISFTAKPGETTAIIGSTGCGKSTLLNLIPRFYDVTGGKVTVDGIDVREMPQAQLHDLLGYVPQKGVLFSGTIASNLKFGGEAITDAQVQKAAAIAQATDFIEAKPEGYQSPIAQGGSNVLQSSCAGSDPRGLFAWLHDCLRRCHQGHHGCGGR